MTLINLVPWREQERKEKKFRFLILLAIGLSATLVFIFIYHLYLSNLLSHQENRVNFLGSEITEEKASLAALQKKKKMQTDITNKIYFIFSLREKNYQAVRLLDELARVVPDTVLLTEVKWQKGTVNVSGKAKSNLEVALFMEKIAKSLFFEEPVLTEISGKEDEGTEEQRNFKLMFKQKEG